MILYEKNGSKIEVINNDIVRKTFIYDISNFYNREWLNQYNKLRELDPRYIEVYNVGHNYIDMKYIKNACTLSAIISPDFDEIEISKKYNSGVKKELIIKYLDLLLKAQHYLSIVKNITHYDLGHGNILVDENNKLIVIDPDSFRFNPNYTRLLEKNGAILLRTLGIYYRMLETR